MLEALRRALGLAAEPEATTGLRLACTSDTGRRRPHNEDNFLFFGQLMPREHQSLGKVLSAEAGTDELVCAAVLDGMGGELAGEAASYAAALALRDAQPTLEPSAEALGEAFRAMQDAVSAVRINARLSTIGTTATVLVAQGARALVANLGDSPAFLLRDRGLATLTVEHTDAELLRELGINRKPGLTQFLGMDEGDAPIEPHFQPLALEPGDRILLASDGLTDMVSLRGIAQAMREAGSPQELVSRLCDEALEAGGADNVTIIACEAPARTHIGTIGRRR